MSLITKLSAVALLAGAVGSSNATLISFISLADVTLGEGPISTYTQDGVTISFSATKGTGSAIAPAYAYLDNNVAGVGVCGVLLPPASGIGVNECNPGTDDNIQATETLFLKFSQDVLIDKAWYNNNHEGGLVLGNQILVNNVAKGVVTTSAYGGKGRGLVDDDYYLTAGTAIAYSFNSAGRQYYIDAIDFKAVPEPTTLGLFGLGLGLLGFGLRRRKA